MGDKITMWKQRLGKAERGGEFCRPAAGAAPKTVARPPTPQILGGEKWAGRPTFRGAHAPPSGGPQVALAPRAFSGWRHRWDNLSFWWLQRHLLI